MATSLASRVRIGQTRAELNRLRRETTPWFKKVKQDKYDTQLKVLQATLNSAIDALGAQIAKLKDVASTQAIYAACRGHDDRIAWLRRVWGYFRHKFDQRADDALRPTLDAADEVVWSCYAAVFDHAGRPRRAAPLPYLEPLFSPQAIPRDDPPPELESHIDAPFLKEFLTDLPIPIISLPPSCLAAPWSLVLLAHETGHHVQHDLAPDFALVGSFAESVRKAALNDPPPRYEETEAARWFKWGQEVFADVFSVHCAGAAAVRAIVELELNDEALMLARKPFYPAPLVRLKLLAETARQLGLDGDDALGTTGRATVAHLEQAPGAAALATDLQAVPKIVAAARATSLEGLGTFADLSGWADTDAATVAQWKDELLKGADIFPPQDARSARLLASAAAAGWAEVCQIEDEPKRADAEATLSAALLKNIAASREPGTRALAIADAALETAGKDLGDRLANLLLKTPAERLRA